VANGRMLSRLHRPVNPYILCASHREAQWAADEVSSGLEASTLIDRAATLSA
jgi:hypothetical protein